MEQTVGKQNASDIKVLGSGCAKCHALETATKEALKELGMDTSIEHVTDFSQIAAYGVMTTPALVVDYVVHIRFHRTGITVAVYRQTVHHINFFHGTRS